MKNSTEKTATSTEVKSRTNKSRLNTSKIILSMVITAMLVALAVIFDIVTSFVPILKMPQGGHVTLSLIPLVILCLICGPTYGFIGTFTYAFFNLVFDGLILSPYSILLDYFLAFGLIGLTSFFHPLVYNKKNRYLYPLSIVIGSLIRYFFSGISGAVIFAEYAPEGVNPWFYSFVLYNLGYLGVSCIVSAILILPLIKPVEIVLKNPTFSSLVPRNVKEIKL